MRTSRSTKTEVIATLLRAGKRRLANVVAYATAALMSVDEALKTLSLTLDQLEPDVLKRAYREASKRHHPDRGGSKEEMQRVNEAYEVLQKQSKRGPSPSQRAERELRWEQAAAVIKMSFEKSFDADRFTKHFEKAVGQKFTAKHDIKQTRYDVWLHSEWKSSDGLTSFELGATAQISNLLWAARQLGAGGQDYSFPITVDSTIFHETRKVKFAQRDWDVTSRHTPILDPEELFPTKKIQQMIGGKEKARKFSKRDMLLGIQKRLDGKVDKEWAYIPFGKDGTLNLWRSTLMGLGDWNIHSVRIGKEKVQGKGFASALETEELLTALIEMQKKAKNETDGTKLYNLALQTLKDVFEEQRKRAATSATKISIDTTKQGRPFDLMTIIPKRTWSLIWNRPPHKGLEVSVITGKKRLAAILEALEKSGIADFAAARKFVFDWRKAHPR